MSGSKTITAADGLLENVHPGEVLREDYQIGGAIDLDEVARGTGIDRERLRLLIESRIAVDADLDLRLGRYFGVSRGFFLRLQNSYDMEEVVRTHGSELDRIVPRAA